MDAAEASTMNAAEIARLTALSPLDGRYAAKADPLREQFSEFALIRQRVRVELAWLAALAAEPSIAEVPPFSAAATATLAAIGESFSPADAVSAQKTWDHEAGYQKLIGSGAIPGASRAFCSSACAAPTIRRSATCWRG